MPSMGGEDAKSAGDLGSLDTHFSGGARMALAETSNDIVDDMNHCVKKLNRVIDQGKSSIGQRGG